MSDRVATWAELDEPDTASFVIEEHRHYLADAARTSAFVRAVEQRVAPGSVYTDLGCGTGVLSFAACRAGARRVFAIDRGDIIHVAERLARENGVADRITFVRAHSRAVTLDEPADVVSFEYVGAGGFHVELAGAFCDVRDRWLKPCGHLIPSALRGRVALVHAPDRYARISFWERPVAGFDVSAARAPAAEWIDWWHLDPQTVRSTWGLLVEIDFASMHADVVRGQTTLRATAAGCVHGLTGVFEADLAPGITLTNDPASASPSSRPQQFIPFGDPIDLAAGDEVDVAFTANVRQDAAAYRVVHRPRSGAAPRRFDITNLGAKMIDRASLARQRADARPARTPEGDAARLVLRLAAEGAALDAINAAVCHDHSRVAESAAAARRFTARVLRNARKRG